MKRRLCATLLVLSACGGANEPSSSGVGVMEFDKTTYRGFTLDNVYHSEHGDIHFSLFAPSDVASRSDMTLYVALPGYEGLYFQGVGEHLKHEDFVFDALRYDDNMVVVSPQLSDWGVRSATQTIALTKRLLDIYPIAPKRVLLSGYSGGGETGSLAVDMAPNLFSRFLLVSSKWDGGYDAVAKAKLPIYLFTAEHDSYYGSAPLIEAYKRLRESYGNDESNVVLDVKSDSYFLEKGAKDFHGGGLLASKDNEVMGWLFEEK